jgi:hypothetical protein
MPRAKFTAKTGVFYRLYARLIRPRSSERPVQQSSDAHAWLYPYYSALKRDQGFDLLAPGLQVQALADAVRADYPAKAQEIRDWDYGTVIVMLLRLDIATRTGPRETELWRLQKGARVMRCTAAYFPYGVDLQLLEGANVQRMQLKLQMLVAKGGAEQRAAEWAQDLRAEGWRDAE